MNIPAYAYTKNQGKEKKRKKLERAYDRRLATTTKLEMYAVWRNGA